MGLFEQSDDDENNVPEAVAESDDTKVRAVSSASTRTEYDLRKRTSKHIDELASMHNENDEIVNVVPPFRPRTSIENWDDFDEKFGKYKRKNNLKFRVRNSERTVLYNRYDCFAAIELIKFND